MVKGTGTLSLRNKHKEIKKGCFEKKYQIDLKMTAK
jgi:hypothetical protein